MQWILWIVIIQKIITDVVSLGSFMSFVQEVVSIQ